MYMENNTETDMEDTLSDCIFCCEKSKELVFIVKEKNKKIYSEKAKRQIAETKNKILVTVMAVQFIFSLISYFA